ncbi:MAG: extracellular solute-binding protein [Deltaproteobacteria bacterium]|nr:extracellular solute-binding protein [Deltaproteobacteria bacterium]
MKRVYCLLVAVLAIWFCASSVMAQGHLFLYNWTDYTSPDLIKKFEKETGIKITLDTYDSNETLLAKLKAGGGGYDIVVPSQNFVPIMIKEGLLQKINASQLKGYENIIDSLKSPPWDPGNVYSVPWQNGTTAFSVNTDVYKGDINTYKILFEPPPELQGKIAMFGSPDEVIPMALIYLGFEQCNENPREMKQVQELLLRQKPYVKVYNSDGILERLISGDVAIHCNWNGYAMRTRMQNPSIKYAYPVEGVLSWADSLVVPKDAKNRENAIKFIEFMLKPENAAVQSNFARYSNGIKGSEAFMDEDLKNAPEMHVPPGIKRVFNMACSEKSIKLYDRVWTRLMQ